MLRIIISVIMIGGAIAIFVAFVSPRYGNVKQLRAEEKEFDKALDSARELQAVRDDLLRQYNSFPASDLERLEKLLPDNIDNVKLILELDVLASRYGLPLRDVEIERFDGQDTLDGNANELQFVDKEYGVVGLEFTVEGPYGQFVEFMENLEESLRIIDVEDISFSSVELGNEYEYTVNIRTYWLK